MNTLTGMEKFSHLEDKIYLTIEYAKKMREEKEALEKEVGKLRGDAANAIEERNALNERVTELLGERDSIQTKVEAMLEAMTMLDVDFADAAGGQG